MGEIRELFVLALSLVWFAGATPDSGLFQWDLRLRYWPLWHHPLATHPNQNCLCIQFAQGLYQFTTVTLSPHFKETGGLFLHIVPRLFAQADSVCLYMGGWCWGVDFPFGVSFLQQQHRGTSCLPSPSEFPERGICEGLMKFWCVPASGLGHPIQLLPALLHKLVNFLLIGSVASSGRLATMCFKAWFH